MRMLDHLTASGYSLELNDLRLWFYNKNNDKPENTIETRISAIKEIMEDRPPLTPATNE